MTLIASGEWEVANDTDMFTAELVAGQSYVIELIGADGYVYQVREPSLGGPGGPGGFSIDPEIADFAGYAFVSSESGRAPGHFTATAGGTHYFSATGLGAGGYTVRLTAVADDFADDASSAGAFRNGLVRGRAEALNDTDWFGAELEAGQGYRYQLSSKGAYRIAIVDEKGVQQELAPVDASGAGLFVPEKSGHYEFVVIEAFEGAPGSFRASNYALTLDTVAVVDDFGHTPATAGRIVLNTAGAGSATGTWERPIDKDWFAVDVVAGQTYSVKASGAALGTDDSGSIVVVDAAGFPASLPQGFFTGGNTQTSFTAKATGTVYVQMKSDLATGAYKVDVQKIADDFTDSAVRPGSVAVNGSASGVFEANNDVDWFRVDLVAGQSYSTSWAASGRGDYAGVPFFIDGEGGFFGQTFTAEKTGTYYVQVLGAAQTAAPRGGAYSLSVASYRDDYADNVSTTGTVTVGATASGNTEVLFDEDWFKVTLEAGKSYQFGGAGAFPGIPVIVQLVGADGVARSANGVYTATESGTHYFSVTGIFPGAYTLSVVEYADDYGDTPPLAGAFVDAPGFVNDGVTLTGTSNADNYRGGGRGDLLQGREGADRLDGRGGNDFLDGGAGADRMAGGIGDDTYVVDDRGDRVTELAGEGTDRVVSAISYRLGDNVEHLSLSGATELSGTGNALANTIVGNAGRNLLSGVDGDDMLFGGAGDDMLSGGTGQDTLTGGAGRDTMTGGTGADRFVFFATDAGNRPASADRITDFNQAEGDRIDLTAIDARPATAIDDAFVFIADRAFRGRPGDLRAEIVGAETFVSGDIDGDGAADFMIRLTGAHTLTAADFAL